MLKIPILLSLASLLPAQQRETMPDPDVPRMLRALRNGSPKERASAAEILGRTGNRLAIPTLIELLRYEDSAVQEAAMVALNGMGATHAAPEIRRFLRSSNGALRMLAALTLLHFEDEASLSTILGFLQSGDVNLRREMTRLLEFIPIEEAVPALEAALEDPDPQVRLNAIAALGMTRQARSIPKLEPFLEAEQEALRTAALMSLAATAPEKYKEQLLYIFQNPSPLSRRVVLPLTRLQVPEAEQMIMEQTPGAPLLNFYNEPEICEKLRSERLMFREVRWISLEEICELISERIGVPVECAPSIGDAKRIHIAGSLGLLGYRPEAFALLNSLGAKYWTGTDDLISFIIDDGKVVLVPVPEADEFFKARAEKRKSGIVDR